MIIFLPVIGLRGGYYGGPSDDTIYPYAGPCGSGCCSIWGVYGGYRDYCEECT